METEDTVLPVRLQQKAKPREITWRHVSDVYDEGLAYVKGRRDGTIKSLRTRWPTMNEVTVQGLEWHTIIIIAGRPASGKTMMMDQLVKDIFELNPQEELCVLDFQFEMVGQSMALRDIARGLKMETKDLNSSSEKGSLSEYDLQRVENYVETKKNLPIHLVDKPCTVKEFKAAVDRFHEEHKKPFIVTVDHSILFARDQGEKDVHATLNNLGNALTEMKKKYKVIFIVLSQLNRNCESLDRLKPGTIGNYLMDSDMYGADALLQHTDILAMLNRPYKYHLYSYGPDKLQMTKNIVVVHYNKVRNGEPTIGFFNGLFSEMRLIEIPITQLGPLAAKAAAKAAKAAAKAAGDAGTDTGEQGPQKPKNKLMP